MNMFIDDESQENNSLVYRDEESNNQPDFYQQIQKMNSQQNYYEDTVKQLQQQLNRNEEAHKYSLVIRNRQHMIHLETVGMMSKYQLVFTKMEAAIHRLGGLIKIKQMLAFIGQRQLEQVLCLQQYTQDFALLSDLIIIEGLHLLTIIRLKGDQIIQCDGSQSRYQLSQRLMNLHIRRIETHHAEMKQKDEQEKQKRLCIQKLTNKDEEIEKAKKRNEEIDQLFWQAKQRENELQQQLQVKQRTIQKYEAELLEYKRNEKPSSTTNKQMNPNHIEHKLKELESSNSILGMQMQQSQNSISTFVREMNELLDSHSLLMDLQEEQEPVHRRNVEVSSFRNGQKIY